MLKFVTAMFTDRSVSKDKEFKFKLHQRFIMATNKYIYNSWNLH